MFNNQYEVEANLLLQHLAKFSHKSVRTQLIERFQFEALGKRSVLIHLLAWKQLEGTTHYEGLLIDKKQSVVSSVNLPIYKAWLKAKARVESLNLQLRVDDIQYGHGQVQSMSGQKGNIQFDADDLPAQKLTVQGVSDFSGTSYKNIRQGAYMGKKTR